MGQQGALVLMPDHQKPLITRKNAQKRSGSFGNEFRATKTSHRNHQPQKPLEPLELTSKNPNPPPPKPYLAPTTENDQHRRSTRTRRASTRDDDDKFFRTSYTNHSVHKTGGGTNAVGEEQRDNEDEEPNRGKESLTEPNRAPEIVTNESAKAAVLEDLISYLDALLQDDCDKWEKACRDELEMLKSIQGGPKTTRSHGS